MTKQNYKNKYSRQEPIEVEPTMTYDLLLDKDITLHSEFYNDYRGILRVVHQEGLLELEVGIDTVLVRTSAVYAVTIHGIS